MVQALPTDLWVRVVFTKYHCGLDGILVIDKEKGRSNFWEKVASYWEDVAKSVFWKVGNGRLLRFQENKWVPNVGSLSDHNSSDISAFHELKVCLFLDAQGQWDKNCISQFLPNQIVRKICCINHLLGSNEKDSVVWAPNRDGNFSTKSTFESLVIDACEQ